MDNMYNQVTHDFIALCMSCRAKPAVLQQWGQIRQGRCEHKAGDDLGTIEFYNPAAPPTKTKSTWSLLGLIGDVSPKPVCPKVEQMHDDPTRCLRRLHCTARRAVKWQPGDMH